jgi:hypothetical protein
MAAGSWLLYSRPPRPHYHTIFTTTTTSLPYNIHDHHDLATIPYSRPPRHRCHTIFTTTTTSLPYHIHDHHDLATIPYSRPPRPRYHSIFTTTTTPLPYHIHDHHDTGSEVVVVVNMEWHRCRGGREYGMASVSWWS